MFLYRNTLTPLFSVIILLSVSLSLSAQNSEGGGVYIKNNGKIENCIIYNNYASNGFGISGTAGEVNNCNIVNNYYLGYSNIQTGDLMMDDGTVYHPTYDAAGNIVFPSGYSLSNVIGVCFWTNANNDYLQGRFWVVAVDEVQRYWCPNGLTNNNGWNPVDINSLYNFNDAILALTDYDGKGNTTKIVNYPAFVYYANGASDTLNTSNCAAKYCYKYRYSTGQSPVWFLPSLGQLRELEKGRTVMNTVLSKLGKSQLSGWYWSSNEVSQQQAWAYYFPYSTNLPAYKDKKSNQKVRPVAIFKKTS